MQLKRNVQERSQFCKGCLQNSVGRTESPACTLHLQLLQLGSSSSLQHSSFWEASSSPFFLRTLKNICFTGHFNVSEHKSFSIFFPVYKSSHARQGIATYKPLWSVTEKADTKRGKLKTSGNRGLGSPEVLHQMNSRLKRKGKRDINWHPQKHDKAQLQLEPDGFWALKAGTPHKTSNFLPA